MNNIKKAIVTLATATLLLAACGKPIEAEVVPLPPETTTSEVVPTPTPPQSEVVPTEEYTVPDEFGLPSDIVTTFGKAAKWEDGLTVTVAAPKPYRPSEYAAGPTKWNASFKITLKNGTGKRVEPSDIYLNVADKIGDASAIYDGDIGGSPQTSLRPGKTVIWTVAYGLNSKSLTGLTVEVQRMDTSATTYTPYATVIYEN